MSVVRVGAWADMFPDVLVCRGVARGVSLLDFGLALGFLEGIDLFLGGI